MYRHTELLSPVLYYIYIFCCPAASKNFIVLSGTHDNKTLLTLDLDLSKKGFLGEKRATLNLVAFGWVTMVG